MYYRTEFKEEGEQKEKGTSSCHQDELKTCNGNQRNHVSVGPYYFAIFLSFQIFILFINLCIACHSKYYKKRICSEITALSFIAACYIFVSCSIGDTEQ